MENLNKKTHIKKSFIRRNIMSSTFAVLGNIKSNNVSCRNVSCQETKNVLENK